jgi:hypothetical protein
VKRLLLIVSVGLGFALGIPLTLSVVRLLSGASWTNCLQSSLAWLVLASVCLAIVGILYALLWIGGPIMFAISNRYRLKDLLRKEGGDR